MLTEMLAGGVRWPTARAWPPTGRSGRLWMSGVEPVTDSRSRLTISVDFTGHSMGKILAPLMVRREARKEMPGNVAALMQSMEAG